MTLDFTHDHYRRILRAARDAGYEFHSFQAVREEGSAAPARCFLRHDCDNDLRAAVAMAGIEAEFAIRSTWFVMLRSAMYNLLTPGCRSLVREILGAGHWLGLHFDHAADPTLQGAALRAAVQRERRLLEDEFGVPVTAMSFHQPSATILSRPIDVGMVNTYDRSHFDGVFYYSDSNMSFRQGCPSGLFRSRHQARIQLLIHPEWWTAEPMPLADKWAHMLTHNFELAVDSLERREAAYHRRHLIRFVVE